MADYIKHFPITDMGYSYFFSEAFEKLDSTKVDGLSICELIELYPVTKYLADIPFLNDEAKQVVESHREIITTINKKLGKYFSMVNDDVFLHDIQEAKNRDTLIPHTFIEALEHYTTCYKITEISILFALENHIVPVYLVLQQKNICLTFKNAIKKYLLSVDDGICHLVSEYDEKTLGPKTIHYQLPDFTEEEIDLMVDKYINNQYANLNIVGCLMNHQSNKNTYLLSPLTRTKIKKAYQRLKNQLFEKGGAVVSSNDVEVRIDLEQEEPIVCDRKINHTLISYSGKWIEDNIDDKATILNNLIYLIELVDKNFRFNNLPQVNSGNGLMDAFDNRHKDEYGEMVFHEIDNISNLCFRAYYEFLRSKGVSLEKVYEWFASDYLSKEFNLKDFDIDLYSGDDNYKHKCQFLFNEIDRLLKIYMVYQKYGAIDEDIFNEETLGDYHNLKSLNGEKYIYSSDNKDLKRIMHLLFSDQSMLNYINRQKEERSFTDLLMKHTINVDEIKEYNKKGLLFLKNNGIITIDKEGIIAFEDIRIVVILKELYHRGFLDILHLDKRYASVVEELEQKGWIVKGDTLFSKQEGDYLNYYLLNKQFSNPLALRNKYEHPKKLKLTKEELYGDYIKGLKILGLIIVKINDELCLLEQRKL